MTDRTKPWAKCWRETWRDEASDRLDMCATLVRQFLAQHVGAVDEHGTGWATTREGRPMVLANIARPCKATHEQAEAALRQLVDVGLIVERDGAWGTLCWATTQEDPEAKRKREWREKQAGLDPSRPRPVNVPGHVPSMSRDGDDQRTEDRGQRTESPHVAGPRAEISPSPPAPTDLPIGARIRHARELLGGFSPATIAIRANIPRGVYGQIEADDVLPTREQLERLAMALGQPEIAAWTLPARDEQLVVEVVREHRRLGLEVGAVDPNTPTGPGAHDVTAVYAAEDTDRAFGLTLAEGWRRVLRRAAEQLRRELIRGNTRGRQYFTLASLAGKRRRDLLTAVDLDRRDETTPVARGSPARRRGPAPPQNVDAPTPRIPE